MNEHYVAPSIPIRDERALHRPLSPSLFGIRSGRAVRKPDTKLHHEIQCSFSPVSEVRCRELLTVGLRDGMRVCYCCAAQVAIQKDNAEVLSSEQRELYTHVAYSMDPWTWDT